MKTMLTLSVIWIMGISGLLALAFSDGERDLSTPSGGDGSVFVMKADLPKDEKPRYSASGYDITPLSQERIKELAADLDPEAFQVLIKCGTERPGTGSLLSSLFADPAVGNPLEGDTLLWARLQDDALHVYSLAIDPGGGFALEH
jgi:hypothetical protein